ncbi:hypothetical protein A3K63_03990 [Candidatus Micrarchaeota archaeon RBG_16_49_10]|nr:MAG: hypothetical protein A3K63_03990 [Candidatus Micrarchaeota archaeon RBG_16_49_10]
MSLLVLARVISIKIAITGTFIGMTAAETGKSWPKIAGMESVNINSVARRVAQGNNVGRMVVLGVAEPAL